MTHTPRLRKYIFWIVSVFFFSITAFFVTAYSSTKKTPLLSACLTAEEKADLEYFFRYLLFENYGAYVLFGSKPLCQINFSDTESTVGETAFQNWYNALPPDQREEIESKLKKKNSETSELERNLYRGWLAWEKVRKTIPMKRFMIRFNPLRGLGYYEVTLINIQQTALVIAENYSIFKEAAGIDFHPLKIVFECEDLNSIFWNQVFSLPNHVTKGLLFGFGLKNSLFADWKLTFFNTKPPSEQDKLIIDYLKSVPSGVSTKPVKYGKGSLSNFTIPLFGVYAENKVVKKYVKEKAKIEKIYQGQDLVEVTLQRLAS